MYLQASTQSAIPLGVRVHARSKYMHGVHVRNN